MMRPGHVLLMLLAACALIFGYIWWSATPRFPVRHPAAELVLQQADLPAAFQPLAHETTAIFSNPYADDTEHFRSGYRAEFAGTTGSHWENTRVVSSSFVVDEKGAEKIYRTYVGRIRFRGEMQSFPPLGQESMFVLSRNEPSAPVVVIGVVRVRNALITLTVMTDRDLDPILVYNWAQALVSRARPN